MMEPCPAFQEFQEKIWFHQIPTKQWSESRGVICYPIIGLAFLYLTFDCGISEVLVQSKRSVGNPSGARYYMHWVLGKAVNALLRSRNKHTTTFSEGCEYHKFCFMPLKPEIHVHFMDLKALK